MDELINVNITNFVASDLINKSDRDDTTSSTVLLYKNNRQFLKFLEIYL